MKCLTVSPAMAWCIAMRFKTLETRTRRFNYRGPLAIASSKKLNVKHYDYLKSIAIRLPPADQLEYGKIVCTTKLVDCVSFTKELEPFALWPHYEGFGLWLEDTVMLERPIPVKGQLGIYEAPWP